MKYIIYKGVDEKQFYFLKEKLNKIELISSPLMQTQDFYLNRDSYHDVLALDYLHKDEKFLGNIGLRYIEDNSKNSQFFEFYIIKSYDLLTQRFYKKMVLEKKHTLDEVYENVTHLFNECLVKYKTFNENELIEKIELRK